MSRSDESIWPPLLVLVVVIGSVLLFMGWHNSGVDDQIKQCLATGGIPVVSDSHGFDDFHACAHPTLSP